MPVALPEAVPAGTSCAVRFMLEADVAPGLLPRLLQPFAKRDLVPDRMWSHRMRDTLHIEIAMDAMPGEFVHLVEGNLRQVVGVHSVTRVAEAHLAWAA